jgi:hypothetical protein
MPYVMAKKITTKAFWQKNFTKEWLALYTTFAYPATVTPELLEFQPTLDKINELPSGAWVFKPNAGRKSRGVILFEKIGDDFRIFPSLELISLEAAKENILKLVSERIFTPKSIMEHRRWFVEEWIHPHERFHQFTVDKRCPPVIRFCGHPEIHFIGMSPVDERETGISAAGWQERKYIWLDLEGVVRPLSDMDLRGVDAHSVDVAQRKSLESAPFGLKIEGIPEVVEQINREIAPSMILYHNMSWSCDGIFDTTNKFIVIEMNHGPGLQFIGFSWKK